MIDLHSHLLPGIDDGAATLSEALELAQMAVADGISHMVMTPHVHPGRYANTRQSIIAELDGFRRALDEHCIPLQIYAAGEVRLCAEVLAMFAAQQLPFLGTWQGQNVLLLELPHSHVPPGSDKLVKWLLQRNVVVMIAHPERNKGFLADVTRLAPFVEMGCLFQLTAMSVTGEFGQPAQSLAFEMLEKGWATVIASDAHNHNRRPPLLSAAHESVVARLGESEARRLFFDRPAHILGIA